MYRLKKILLEFRKNYNADPRALAIMRIGIALIVICDLAIRMCDLEAHYTDAGIWPTDLIKNFGWNHGYWSAHALSGGYEFQLILFVLHFICALGVLFGFRTRLSTMLTWLLTISLHNRNIFILQSGDDLLRMVLFWGLFLPWNQVYSLDAKAGRVRNISNVWVVPGYFALIASVYFFSVILKTDPEWHSQGLAVYYALSLEQLRLPLGDFIYNYPGLLKILTHLVYYTEFLVPIFILLPSRSGRSRLLAFAMIFMLHVGFALTLYVGLFYIIGIVSAIGLIPGFVFDKLWLKLRTRTAIPKTKILNQTWLINSFGFLSAFAVCICLIINLSTVGWFPYRLRDEINTVTNALRLNQYWGMFSPGVLKEDGWFVYHGMDSIGRQWDLRRNEDYVDYSKPQHIVSMYKSDRWRKLAENMQSNNYTFLRPLYCKYILRKWNKEHPKKKLFTLNLYFMQKTNLENYKTTVPEKKLHCVCDEH
ncbi:MAG: HTTM domain-containing protein [Bacteroidia bacterium]|nr:HTTM domain-containing protein [Bacteroidia bacterium]